jgi:hypothetical protein
MRPLSFPCGCLFNFYQFTDTGEELWESELCDFHKNIMSEYLKEADVE